MIKFCRECKWSKPEHRSEWLNRCYHDKVVRKNYYALANVCDGKIQAGCGVDCGGERKKKFFAPCGMKGKLWEKK